MVLSMACVVMTERVDSSPLLFALDRQESGGHSPVSEPPIEIWLQHDPGVLPFQQREIGRGILWDDGDFGTVDFRSSTDPGFDALVAGLTNGVDDYLFVLTPWPGYGGGGGGGRESEFGFGSPDFVGYEIDRIRLIVHDVQIEPWEDGYSADVDVTYEFYGSPIPEPATAILLGLGGAVLCRWRLRFRRDDRPVRSGRYGPRS
jgi:hypothetical protein